MSYRKITKKDLLEKYSSKIDILKEYAQMIYDQNQVMNITGFKTVDDIFEQGILDSILAFENYMMQYDENLENKKILDVGAGAGFPSIPVLIALDNKFNLTIIESQKKRCNFLEKIKARFNLNVNIINSRVEEFFKLTNYFEIITARAVASIKVLYLSAAHLLKNKGKFVLLKGENFIDELTNIVNIAKYMGEMGGFEYDNVLNKTSSVVVINKGKIPDDWPHSWAKINKM